MPSHTKLEPASAFEMYKKLNNKQSVKKKKRKQIQSKEISLKIVKTQKYKKTRCDQDSPEDPPILVEVDPTSLKRSLSQGISSNKQKRKMQEFNLNEKNTSNDDPSLEAFQLFKWLISPLPPESFFKTYWERKPTHIKRSNENYYTHILDSAALDKILRNNSLHYSRNVDVVSYENGAKQIFNQEGRALPSALWDYYSNGCSIRILNPQTYNHKIHLLIATLQEYFGTMVGTNVYLTPPGSQGFAPHYDDIEAFVVQLEGRKHWKLYQPKGSDVLARYSSPNLKHEDIGDPFMELTLEAGEILYFPRGTIHEGRTDEDSHSLHITVSVYQQTSYADLLQHILPNALKKASEHNVEFRRGLPLNYLKKIGIGTNSDNKSVVIDNIRNLLGTLINYMDIDKAADQLGKKFMHDSMPPVLSKSEVERTSKADGAYLKNGTVINSVEISLDTKVRLLRYYCVRLIVEDDSSPKLYYNTENALVYHGEEEQWLELDASMIPVICMLQNTYPNYVEVEELPMEDVSVKMQLISDLWEHGLLVTEQPLEPID